jgi:hypothetical protein
MLESEPEAELETILEPGLKALLGWCGTGARWGYDRLVGIPDEDELKALLEPLLEVLLDETGTGMRLGGGPGRNGPAPLP